MATSVSMMQQRYHGATQWGRRNVYPRFLKSPLRKKHPPSLQDEHSLQQGVNETLKEAALINIVAAVNDNQTDDDPDRMEITAAPGSAIDSLSNTMAVISNLMNARRRTVSIPRTSKVQDNLNLQQNTVQKKPVYYKHSEDEEVSRRDHQFKMFESIQRLEGNSRKSNLTNQNERSKPAKEVIIKSLPTRPHAIEYNFMHKINFSQQPQQKSKLKTRERESESRSSIRKLGTLKKSEQRKVHKLPKCDAVDLTETDTSTNIQEIFNVLNINDMKHTEKGIPKTSDIKFFRAKSLPTMLPQSPNVSRSNVSSPTRNMNTAIRGRHLSRSMTQRTPDSLYKRTFNMPSGYGFEKLTICNGLNQDPDITSPTAHESKKPLHNKQPYTGSTTQKSNWKQRATRPSLFSQTTKSDMHDMNRELDTYLTGKRVFFTESETEFRDAVKSAMNGNIDSQYEEVVYSVTPTGKSSSLSGVNVDNSGKGEKHVQVLRRRYLSDSSDESTLEEKVDMEPDGATMYHGARMIHAPVSTSVSYPPISASQLLRIQQKVIPANINTEAPVSQPYFTTASGITLQSIQRQKSDVMVKSFVKSDGDAKEIEIKVTQHLSKSEPPELTVQEEELSESDEEVFTERHIACSPIGRDINTATSRSRPESGDGKSDPSFYKLVKAVDTHSYAEFEHKKLRRLAPGVCGKALEHRTTEFVKIKL